MDFNRPVSTVELPKHVAVSGQLEDSAAEEIVRMPTVSLAKPGR